MSSLALILSLLASSPGVPVDVGKFDPSEFPNLITLERQLPHAEMTSRVQKIFAEDRCKMDGQSKLSFDITIPYALLMDAEGDAKRVVVEDLGCAPLETLVGQIVVARAGRGDFEIKHGGGEQWYASEVYFSLGEPQNTAALEDPDKVICKRGEPALGSRLKFTRTCKTAAEWQAFRSDRRQLRRDLQNAAACGGSASCSSF